MQRANRLKAQLTWQLACCCASRRAGATHCCTGVVAALPATGLAVACERTAKSSEKADEVVNLCYQGCRHKALDQIWSGRRS